MEGYRSSQTHPRYEHIQIWVLLFHSDDELLACWNQLVKWLDTAASSALGLAEVHEIVARHDIAITYQVTRQFSTGASVAIERMEEYQNSFRPHIFGRFPGMGHKFGAMVVPVLVDGIIGNFFHKLHIQFSERIDPLQLIITLIERYVVIVLVVQLELISMSLGRFAGAVEGCFMADGGC